MASLTRGELVVYAVVGIVVGLSLGFIFHAPPPPIDVAYAVTVSQGDELLSVAVLVENLSSSSLILHQRIYDDWMGFSDLMVVDGDGNPLSFETRSQTIRDIYGNHSVYSFVVDVSGVEEVVVSYTVRPGAVGRHGHRGYLADEWGMVAGEQVFLLPEVAQPLGEVSVSFETPTGYDVSVPWERRQDGAYDPVYGDRKFIFDSFASSTIVFGGYTTTSKRVGAANVSVHVEQSLGEDEASVLADRSFALCDYFEELFGEFPGTDYHFFYTPAADDGVKVVGGMWANGVGLTSPGNDSWEWQLVSHRLFHRWSWYAPYGTKVPAEEDVWFLEGKPNYYQIKSTAAIGLTNTTEEFDALYRRYQWDRGSLDAPLTAQPNPPSPAHWEFLSFTKAPLVAKLMAEKIAEDSGGEKSFDDFNRRQYEKFGHRQGTYDLQEELEGYTGEGWSAFFENFVEGVKELPPP